MEYELERKIFYVEDFVTYSEMTKAVEIYFKQLQKDYPTAVVTKEYYKGKSILVRATKIVKNYTEKEKEENDIEIGKSETDESGFSFVRGRRNWLWWKKK